MTDSDLPIGRIITLTNGDARAEITSVGAHLRRLQVGERDLILRFSDDLPWGAHGAVLAPWPNRIKDGHYSWGGRDYVLPITESERNTAIHGLVMTAPWQVSATNTTAVLTTDLAPSQGYPFPLQLQVRYTLSETALDVAFSATNTGTEPAPFGVGFHPWLDLGPQGVEGALLELSAGTWFETDSQLIPIAQSSIPPAFDFSTSRLVGDTNIDDAFGDPMVAADERSWVHVDCADGTRISVWMSAPLTVWQLCTHPGEAPRPGLAVEPMSCPADAFNNRIGLHTLHPGDVFDAHWGLGCTTP